MINASRSTEMIFSDLCMVEYIKFVFGSTFLFQNKGKYNGFSRHEHHQTPFYFVAFLQIFKTIL